MTPILIRLAEAVAILLASSALYWALFKSMGGKGIRDVIRSRVRVWAYGLVFSASAGYFVAGVPALRDTAFARILQGVLMVSLAAVLVELVAALLFEMLLPARRHVRLPYLIQSLARGIAYLAIALAFLRTWGVDVSSLLAGSAIFSVVMGLALQESLGNLFSGLAVDVARPFRLGDWVRVGDQEGRVESISWRATSLVTRDGTQVILPNRDVAQRAVLNYSWPSARQRITIPVRAHYRHPPGQVEAALLACACDSPGVCAEPVPEVQIESFGAEVMGYVLKLHVEDYARRPAIESEVRRRIWYRFRRDGIDIPYAIGSDSYAGGETDTPTLADRVDLLRHVGFFAGLGEPELGRLAEMAAIRTFARGELIVRQGEPGETLYLIRRGQVEVRVLGADGSVAFQTTLEPGAFFGEISLMTGAPRTASVVALTDAELLEVEKDGLRPLLESNPELAAILSRALAERQLSSQARLAEQAAHVEGPAGGDIESTSQQILSAVQRFFSF